MNYILDKFQEIFWLEYDPKNKILYIKKKIKVADFYQLKMIIKRRRIKLNDIRVEAWQ